MGGVLKQAAFSTMHLAKDRGGLKPKNVLVDQQRSSVQNPCMEGEDEEKWC